MAIDTGSLKARLEKKATFQAAIRDLEQALRQQHGATQTQELLPLVARCHTLLKARYSNPAFWRLGRSLFEAAAASAGSHASNQAAIHAKLLGYLADADSFLAEDEEQPTERQQTLGELLLGLPPPQAIPSHLSDAGLVLDIPPQPPPAAAAAAAAASGAAAEDEQPQLQPPLAGAAVPAQAQVEQLLRRFQQQLAGRAEGQGEQGQEQQQDQQQQQEGQQQQDGQGQQQDGQQLPPTSPEEQAMLIELLAGQLPRAELEALLQQLTEPGGAQHQAKPAASKNVVASLPVLQLSDEAALASIGGPGTACPVCTETLALGDSVQQLPCRHVYHVPCLAPWLKQNNSCPVCRHELPTDDHAYEARKEREVEEAEAQRGAANALSHNEFAYI